MIRTWIFDWGIQTGFGSKSDESNTFASTVGILQQVDTVDGTTLRKKSLKIIFSGIIWKTSNISFKILSSVLCSYYCYWSWFLDSDSLFSDYWCYLLGGNYFLRFIIIIRIYNFFYKNIIKWVLLYCTLGVTLGATLGEMAFLTTAGTSLSSSESSSTYWTTFFATALGATTATGLAATLATGFFYTGSESSSSDDSWTTTRIVK